MNKQQKPAWWLLDSLVLLFLGALLAVHYLYLPSVEEDLLQIATILVFYGLVAWWVHANSASLSRESTSLAARLVTGRSNGLQLTETQSRYRQAVAFYTAAEARILEARPGTDVQN
jgi:hypothetical protein